MTLTIIITLCVLLLTAYIFDLTSDWTRIPSVVLLLLLGWIVRQVTELLGFHLPDLSSILPVLGTVGLILIVLEGSLELNLNRTKFKLINTSFLGSLVAMLVMAFALATVFYYTGNFSYKSSLLNAIPLCVISSAIAIPTVRNLKSSQREFITYESSFSDIAGVIFFNYIALNDNFGVASFGTFGLQIVLITVLSFAVTVGLTLLLGKIEHHIKFIPIILLVILIYAIAKHLYLPALIFILVFGLFLGNLEKLKRFPWIDKYRPDDLLIEVRKFKELTIEAAFLTRALFFLLFGYLIETPELLNPSTILWAWGIIVVIYVIRAIQLKLSGWDFSPMLWVAPRGLITILLFLSVTESARISLVNRSLIIQVIILSSLVMMAGMMASKKRLTENRQPESQPEPQVDIGE